MVQELTENLSILADMVEGAELIHASFEACGKCCKDRESEQEKMDAANAALRFVSASLRYADEHRADWRFELSSDLDKFARMILEKRSGTARRVIKNALVAYRTLLTERINGTDIYSADALERSEVSACLIELFDE